MLETMGSSAGRDGNEARAIRERADRLDLVRDGSGHRRRVGQASWGQPSHHLRMAQEVRPTRYRRGQTTDGAGAGGCQAAQAADRP
jgi:hypothetical protein